MIKRKRTKPRKAKPIINMIASGIIATANAITIRIPIMIVSEANIRDHWRSKYRRNRSQQVAVTWMLSDTNVRAKRDYVHRVTLMRVAPNKLDQGNSASAFKHTQDAVAQWLGVDDRYSGLVGYEYAQRSEGPRLYGLQITLHTTSNKRMTVDEHRAEMKEAARAERNARARAATAARRAARAGEAGAKMGKRKQSTEGARA